MSDKDQGLRLYNTLTRTKEAFAPIDPANVRMYVCGPTVYDYAHIGNARPAIVFDVLFRLLRHLYGADHVTYVRNITDVDDKINARALRDYGDQIASGKLSLNEAIRKVTEPTYEQYQKDVTALGCLQPTFQPRATEFVLPRADGKDDMVSLIQSLIDRGHAYEAKGEILFDTTSMADYGQLSKRNLDEQQAGARIAVDAHKKNPQDFVLWKESSAEEPGWEAEFRLAGGTSKAIRGRPGWHIECSAMSAAYLGQEFDIHGGGLDLIFPHHENEIAQSRCAHGTDVMANVWMHNGFLQVEGKKMSKSDGNFVTINELLETEEFAGQRWHGKVLRLAMLMTHYRQPIDFTADRLFEARGLLYDWNNEAHDVPLQPLPVELVEALLDDLSTPNAVTVLHALARQTKKGQLAPDWVAAKGRLRAALAFLGLYEDQPSVDLLKSSVDDVGDRQRIAERIAERLAFIADKNWAEADRIRDELLAEGIQLKDGKDPVTGERVTTWEVKR
ncbi:MAG: cysteine--tRNA ligase [Alphaproteobacteria bacterium]|nr:cysteine--tRNA ligase [Alphaproteobacteria bacterium]MBU0805754.1 cysteine--tRNA ligase [Alphaproteobacteria bacterium]MBU0872491.1 cysteine--tRNA ligase [Alphaproteobacteria bacterium]MBU1402986.1 cysteine--tRNA ligase [Alphaproteobacteria bacterium]MBU1593747.1 cysteine--tRNA ligase [Alphaproteobacteria bacterium]